MKSKHIILILICALLLPIASIHAGGSKEASYQSKLSQTFAKLSIQVDSGDVSVEAAQATLANLRTEYRKPFTDKAGVLNVLLYRIGAGELSSDEANSLLEKMNSSDTESNEEHDSQQSQPATVTTMEPQMDHSGSDFTSDDSHHDSPSEDKESEEDSESKPSEHQGEHDER